MCPLLGRTAHGRYARSLLPWAAVPTPLPPNVDMLAWFDEHERRLCGSCGERACVSVADAFASFCLNCGAISIGGVRIDVDGRLPV